MSRQEKGGAVKVRRARVVVECCGHANTLPYYCLSSYILPSADFFHHARVMLSSAQSAIYAMRYARFFSCASALLFTLRAAAARR